MCKMEKIDSEISRMIYVRERWYSGSEYSTVVTRCAGRHMACYMQVDSVIHILSVYTVLADTMS